jgi:WD40 repeat protein/serine/threonine protein kinase
MSDESIFGAALSKAPGIERRAFLDGACGSDDDLRRRIERLLEADGQAGGILERGPDAGPTDAPGPDEPPLAPERVFAGRFKLRQKLGEGGMGEVWVADQSAPVQRGVAIKVVRPGLDSERMLARFEQERQALALMDHPNIAKVLDAGEAEGRPYFVMELIKGTPITEYCDRARLAPRDRLALFVPVCEAVQHAHQKAIVHRDLKPSNILVALYDGRPVPKVIDFGIAKATGPRLTDRSIYTEVGALIGTLEYMAPEQAELNNLDIDTRADVYALGAILYELLTGSVPFSRQELQAAGFLEMLRVIREVEPPRPSTKLSGSGTLPSVADVRRTDPQKLVSLMRGELDWIILKCLEKDRGRRYQAASGLARDLEHYLADEPVEACPPTAGYRLRKFAHKYRTPLRVASTFVFLLTLAAITSTWQAIRATFAENRASEQRDIAQRKELEAIRAREETGKAYQQVAVANQELQKTTGDLRAALYVSDLNRAYQYWDSGNIQRVEELLERHRPIGKHEDLRGVEWHYLRRLCTRFQAGRIADVRKPVLALTVSHDGKSLATTSGIGDITIWDTATGAQRLHIADASAGNLAYSADGGTLISAGAFQTPERGPRAATIRVRAWDAATGKEVVARRVDVDAREAGHHDLTADGTLLLGSTIDGKLRVWDTATGRKIVTLDAQAIDPSIKQVTTIKALSDDRKTLVWELGGTILVWDLATKTIRLKHSNSLHWSAAVAFSPDGKLVACHRGGPPHVVQLWDWNAGKQMAELHGFAGHVYVLRFSPDGKALAAVDEFGTIRLIDVATSKEIAALKGHGVQVRALAFAPDGRSLYSASLDGLIRRWKLIPDQDPDQFEGDAALMPIAGGVSPDGCSYFTHSTLKRGEQWELIHRDLTNHRELAGFRATGRAVVSGNGKCVVFQKSGERTIRLREIFANREFNLLESTSWPTVRKGFSPDGGVLAWCEPDQIRIWDTETGKSVGSLPHANASAITFSADGRYFAASATGTGDAAPCVTVWKTRTLTEAAKLPGHANALTFAPDGQTLAVIQSDRVMLWDVRSQVVRALINASQPGDEYVFWSQSPNGFSPDGKLFAIADTMHTRLWNTATGELMGYLAGPRESIWTLSWSPDGKTLVTNAHGPKVKLWNVATLEELTTLMLTNRFGCHAFAPDGSLIVGDQMYKIRVWRTGLDRNAR